VEIGLFTSGMLSLADGYQKTLPAAAAPGREEIASRTTIFPPGRFPSWIHNRFFCGVSQARWAI